MASQGSFYQGEKKKKKKQYLEREAERVVHIYTPPKVEIIGKKKREK